MTLAEFRDITTQRNWSSFAVSLMEQQALTPETVTHFGTYWIEAGHHIREQVADDKFLVRLLRKMLPPYKGEEIELFCGENRDRWGRINGDILVFRSRGGIVLSAEIQNVPHCSIRPCWKSSLHPTNPNWQKTSWLKFDDCVLPLCRK